MAPNYAYTGIVISNSGNAKNDKTGVTTGLDFNKMLSREYKDWWNGPLGFFSTAYLLFEAW